MFNKPAVQILYISMEYCEGRNLRHFINESILPKSSPLSNGNLPSLKQKQAELVELKWKIFSQVVDALHYLHGLGLIHRDLKPSNIFLDKNNNVKLGDFGLATHQQHHAGKVGEMTLKNSYSRKNPDGVPKLVNKQSKLFIHSVGIGTPLYMAPEQQTGKAGNYNYLADMYSLGLICFEMFVGGFPTIIEMDKAFNYLR